MDWDGLWKGTDLADLGSADKRALLASLLTPDGSMRAWWPQSYESVLANAAVLGDCAGPEELEQATAELIGAEQAERIDRHVGGHDLLAWMDGLLAALGQRCQEPAAWYLLHGLAAICPLRYQPVILELLASTGPAGYDEPAWLARTARLRAVGPARLLVDAYGCRYGVLIDVTRPGSTARTYLIDIDPCAAAAIPLAGMYAGQDAAVAVWRAQVGPSAVSARPGPVDPHVLVELLPHPQPALGVPVIGNEPPRQLAEFYRMRRIAESLTRELAAGGTSLPSRRLRQVEVATATVRETATDFLGWCTAEGLSGFDRGPVEWVVQEWITNQPDPAALGPSPHRVASFLHFFLEYYADSPQRDAALAIVSTWLRYCLHRADVPADLAEPVVALADRIAVDPPQVARLAHHQPAPPISELTGFTLG